MAMAEQGHNQRLRVRTLTREFWGAATQLITVNRAWYKVPFGETSLFSLNLLLPTSQKDFLEVSLSTSGTP